MIKKAFDIFKIKREERWQALVALILFIVLNALTIIKYNSQFTQLSDNYHKLFVKTFHVAGFDPLTYAGTQSTTYIAILCWLSLCTFPT